MPRHFRVHPAIGTARVGNSPDHYLGAETSGLAANSADGVTFKSFRDTQGRILRQGVRFRVFEYTEGTDGALSNPRELTIGADVLDIEWRVHLANRKASFFSFYGQFGADDLYLARSRLPADQQIKLLDDDPPRTNRRNPRVVSEAERAARLEIDPGEQLISAARPAPVELSNTKPQIPIKSLGTLLVEPAGRLIVIGGYGESNSTETPARTIDEYANNDTWFDDAGDGSVKARIVLAGGVSIDADPAWVLVGPPDFAPATGNVVSLFDTLWDSAVREVECPVSTPATPLWNLLREQRRAWQANQGTSLTGFKPSFLRDIYPLLKRALGARDVHLSGTTGNPHYHQRLLGKWATLSALSGVEAAEGAELRAAIITYLRNPDGRDVQWDKMPRGLGDDYTILSNNPAAPSPRSFLSLTRIQFAMLQEWANDRFLDDWPGVEPVPASLANAGPDDLDRAAVENCVGGPFYPGIEVSWLIRTKELFSEPFRLKVDRQQDEPGAQGTAPLVVGALTFRPGFFSQQMALPWQADFYDCHKERWEDPDGNEFYFMWWSAQRPDDVFPSAATSQLRWVRAFDDPAKSPDENEDDTARFSKMQSRWSELKFVSVKAGDHYEEES